MDNAYKKEKATILIVEYEVIIAIDIQNILESFNYEVVERVTSGAEAIKKAKLHKPDIILMDIKLEGKMDGTEAGKIIMETLNIPIIYLTAHSDKMTLEKALSTDPLGYLLKPINPKDLFTTIETALYKHKRQGILSVLPEANPNFVILVSQEGVVEYVNPAASRFLETSNLSLNEITSFFPENYRGKLKEYRDKVWSEETSRKNIFFNFKLNWIENIELFMVTLTDITELKKLLFEKELFFQAFKNYLNGVVITDIKGKILYVNKKFETFYGYESEEILGNNVNLLKACFEAYENEGISRENYNKLFASLKENIANSL